MMKTAARLSLMLLLAGCASQDPRLHNLSARPGQIRASARQVVLILAPTIPRYLERQEIVRNTGDGTRKLADNDWWDEPLRQMVPRVLAADLSQRLPGAEVVTEAAMPASAADARIAIDIEGFDNAGGEIVLTGHAAIQAGAGARMVHALRITVPLATRGVSGQVDAMSTALGEVADIVAVQLARNAPSY